MTTQPATETENNQLPVAQHIISILWPSFLTAGLATILFFTVFDPAQLGTIVGFPDITRIGGYTMGFFLFWLLTAISSAMTCYFRKPCSSVKQQ